MLAQERNCLARGFPGQVLTPQMRSEQAREAFFSRSLMSYGLPGGGTFYLHFNGPAAKQHLLSNYLFKVFLNKELVLKWTRANDEEYKDDSFDSTACLWVANLPLPPQAAGQTITIWLAKDGSRYAKTVIQLKIA